MWYTSMVLSTLKRSGDLTIGYVMTNSPYMPKFGSLLHPHGLEEAPVVHQPGPSHLGDVWNPIIGFLMANNPSMPNFRSLLHTPGLEDGPVVHQLGPGHLSQVLMVREPSRTCPQHTLQVWAS